MYPLLPCVPFLKKIKLLTRTKVYRFSVDARFIGSNKKMKMSWSLIPLKWKDVKSCCCLNEHVCMS